MFHLNQGLDICDFGDGVGPEGGEIAVFQGRLRELVVLVYRRQSNRGPMSVEELEVRFGV